jgi:hypothetical protein
VVSSAQLNSNNRTEGFAAKSLICYQGRNASL